MQNLVFVLFLSIILFTQKFPFWSFLNIGSLTKERIEKELADRRLWASTEWHDEEHARALFQEYDERSPIPRAAFERQARAALTEGNREDKLKQISIPTLVIHGTADTLISQSGGERTAEVIPDAKLELIDGWGHDLPPGCWPHLIERIVGHINSLEKE